MKFRISKEAFLDGLQKVQHVVSTRTTLPILSNVLLVASNGRIQFTTTDLDVGITGSVEAQIERDGATTLPAKRLVNIVRELPSSEVEVSVDAKNVASIQSGPSFFTWSRSCRLNRVARDSRDHLSTRIIQPRLCRGILAEPG